jgi:DedD protein
MSDQNFHEIQLSGKQLIFLFMCAVVVTVVVFLFGVSVGRGVRGVSSEKAQAAPAPSVAEVPAAETPAPTQAAPNELSYAEALEGNDPSKVTPPTPPAEEPPAEPVKTEPVKTEPPPRKTPVAPPAPKTKPAAPTAAPPATAVAAAKSAPGAGGWVVQVFAFNANDVAQREVGKLQGKGYPAFIFTESASTPGPRYKVRVGPYPGRADADRMLQTLTKEGYKPLLKR